jgi:hypothetical protein
MSSHLPSAKAWVALFLPIAGIFLFIEELPARFVGAAGRTSFVIPVPLYVWIVGAIFILISGIACVVAFKRSSLLDRIIVCLAVLLTLWLVGTYFAFFLLPAHR